MKVGEEWPCWFCGCVNSAIDVSNKGSIQKRSHQYPESGEGPHLEAFHSPPNHFPSLFPSFLSVGNTNSDLLSLSKTRCHQSQFLQNDLLALLGYTPLVAKMPFTVSDHRSSRVRVVCIFDLVLQRTAEKIPQCLCPKVHCCVLGWKGWGQEGWEQSFQNPLRFLQP